MTVVVCLGLCGVVMGRWSLLLTILLISFLTPFVGSSVNVVTLVVGFEFLVDPVLLSWFSTSTSLAMALFLLPVGVFGDSGEAPSVSSGPGSIYGLGLRGCFGAG